jgi:nucleoside phosphorylase
MITVTFALPSESSGFVDRLRKRSRSDRDGVKVIRGEINDRTVEVLHTGVGEKVCRQRVARFLQGRHFEYLISAGFAGALDDQLQVGNLLLAKNFSTVELSDLRSFLSSLPIHIADLLTVPSMIESREERNEIAQTTGAAAVDMETEFIARACAEHGIPLISLRVITDTPSKLFPAPAHVLFDMDRQRTKTTNLVVHLVKNPGAVLRLIAFAKRIARARETLANALVDVVRRIEF